MHRLTVNISDNAFKKIFSFLNKFSETEVEILENQIIDAAENDFIYHLANNPVKVDQQIPFLNREEANAR